MKNRFRIRWRYRERSDGVSGRRLPHAFGNSTFCFLPETVGAYSYRAAVNMRPENDEYKLVFIQVLDDFIEDYRKDDIIAAF